MINSCTKLFLRQLRYLASQFLCNKKVQIATLKAHFVQFSSISTGDKTIFEDMNEVMDREFHKPMIFTKFRMVDKHVISGYDKLDRI